VVLPRAVLIDFAGKHGARRFATELDGGARELAVDSLRANFFGGTSGRIGLTIFHSGAMVHTLYHR
jgi:hypothetical protein